MQQKERPRPATDSIVVNDAPCYQLYQESCLRHNARFHHRVHSCLSYNLCLHYLILPIRLRQTCGSSPLLSGWQARQSSIDISIFVAFWNFYYLFLWLGCYINTSCSFIFDAALISWEARGLISTGYRCGIITLYIKKLISTGLSPSDSKASGDCLWHVQQDNLCL